MLNTGDVGQEGHVANGQAAGVGTGLERFLHVCHLAALQVPCEGAAEVELANGLEGDAPAEVAVGQGDHGFLSEAIIVGQRVSEGERLAEMVNTRLAAIGEQVDSVRSILPEIMDAFKTRLESRLSELKESMDPGRLEQEVVIFANKSDVAEELDRLESHITETQHALRSNKPVGRRLDFLMQEMNREANTLGSKSSDIRVTNVSIELKVLIEQIREQIQNIE